MIESGYDIHLRDRVRCGPYVCAGKRPQCCAGASFHVGCTNIQKGWNALLVATVNGRSEIVRMLLVHGAHMNSRCTVRYLERVCQPVCQVPVQ